MSKRPHNKYRGLRPSVRFEFCPAMPPFAVHWGLGNFLEELFWKSSHFRGLGTAFGKDQYLKVEGALSPRVIGKMVAAGKDPVDEILRRVAEVAQCTEPERTIHTWSLVETTLNARLSLAMAALGPAAAARLFAEHVPWPLFDGRLHLAELRGWLEGQTRLHEFGQPDLLLVNDRQLVMIEMKVRGKASSVAKYGADQLLKYLSVAGWALERTPIQQVCHLILTPEGGQNPFFRPKDWIVAENAKDGGITVRIDGLIPIVKKTFWRKRLTDVATVSACAKLLKAMPIRRLRFDHLLSWPPGASDNPWQACAHRQLNRLSNDAEPQVGHAVG